MPQRVTLIPLPWVAEAAPESIGAIYFQDTPELSPLAIS